MDSQPEIFQSAVASSHLLLYRVSHESIDRVKIPREFWQGYSLPNIALTYKATSSSKNICETRSETSAGSPDSSDAICVA
jgi:hypothetical protein